MGTPLMKIVTLDADHGNITVVITVNGVAKAKHEFRHQDGIDTMEMVQGFVNGVKTGIDAIVGLQNAAWITVEEESIQFSGGTIGNGFPAFPGLD